MTTILTVYHCFHCLRTVVRPKTWVRMYGGGPLTHTSTIFFAQSNPANCSTRMIAVGDRDHYLTAYLLGGDLAVWELSIAEAQVYVRKAAKSPIPIIQTEGIETAPKALLSSAARSSKPKNTGGPKRPPGRHSRRRSR